MKFLCILQARMNSSRLPGKVMEKINGKPMLEWQIRRIQKSQLSEIVIATTTNSMDTSIVELAKSLGIEVVRGSESDVYSRFREVLRRFKSDNFVRVTADCPLFMPELLNAMVSNYNSGNYDYFSNTLKPTFPDGLDIEIIRTEAFNSLSNFELSYSEREHVTLAFHNKPHVYRLRNYEQERNLSKERWTVDYKEDLDFIKSIFRNFQGMETEFNYKDVLEFLINNPNVRNQRGQEFRNISLKVSEEI